MRIDPNVDGPNNTIFQVDATRGEVSPNCNRRIERFHLTRISFPQGEPGSAENFYGNAFYAKKTKLDTMSTGMSDYDGDTSRTWEMANTTKLNPYSKKPVSYKLVSREVPKLLPKDGSLVWKRAGFARHAVHVTKCECLRRFECGW